MHIFFTTRCKNLRKFTQICVIYTNLGRQEDPVNHLHKLRITFTCFLTPKVDPILEIVLKVLVFFLMRRGRIGLIDEPLFATSSGGGGSTCGVNFFV